MSDRSGGRIRPVLHPPAGLARDEDEAWIAAGDPPRFRIEADIAALAGRWVEIRARVVTDAVTVRPALLVETPGTLALPSPFGASARGRGRWIGLLPKDLAGLAFEPIDEPGRFRIDDLSIEILSRPALVRRAVLVDPDEAARAVFWRLLGKKVRARNRIEDLFRRPTATSYRGWLRENERISREERAFMGEALRAWPAPPLISVAMPVYNPAPRELRAAIRSVERQIYPHWELCIADDASTDPRIRPLLEKASRRDPRIRVVFRPENGNISAASNSAIGLVRGEFTALLDHDDLLPPHALFYVAREIAAHPDAEVIYTDEDKVDRRDLRYDPHFKADWNEALFFAQNYLNHLTVIRTARLREVGGFRVGYEGSQDHDLLLRVTDGMAGQRIRHVPRVLYHWRNYQRSGAFSGERLDQAVKARQQAMDDLVARRQLDATIEEGPFGFNRVRRRIPVPAPKVTIVVPTRDAAELTGTCARGMLRTDYPNLELVILDNESREPATAALFGELRRDPRVKIMPMPGAFNFSRFNNRAVAATTGELVAFVNNDIEVIGPDWLSEMVSQITAERVVAVGARLLYPDDHVQHAGLVLGVGGPNGIGGVAAHAQLGARGADPGYFGRLAIPHWVSAVTAACMLVRRDAFEAVGGFDDEHLAVAFNDVDLCLKLTRAGGRILYTPYATLYHHESASRGLDTDPEKVERFNREVRTMLERWGEALRRDPFYNPNFSLVSGHFELKGLTPRRTRVFKPRGYHFTAKADAAP